MATRLFTFRALQAKMLYNNTRQGYAARSILKPAGYSFPVNTPAKPMPSPVGMLKSCGFFISVARPNAYFGCEVLSHVPNAWVDVGIVDYETLFKRPYEKVTALLTQLPNVHDQIALSQSERRVEQDFYTRNALKGDQV
ncbi:hypothetical protein [Marinobacterium sp. MBR-109]|jgi:hypothetical protein|uniref:hypothetical protein n=1 Tax=Marinobacterium sp. MBR-109 TaxID=3156462 RepID=UPI0033920D4D